MTNCWVLAQIGKIEMKRKCIIFTRLHVMCTEHCGYKNQFTYTLHGHTPYYLCK